MSSLFRDVTPAGPGTSLGFCSFGPNQEMGTTTASLCNPTKSNTGISLFGQKDVKGKFKGLVKDPSGKWVKKENNNESNNESNNRIGSNNENNRIGSNNNTNPEKSIIRDGMITQTIGEVNKGADDISHENNSQVNSQENNSQVPNVSFIEETRDQLVSMINSKKAEIEKYNLNKTIGGLTTEDERKIKVCRERISLISKSLSNLDEIEITLKMAPGFHESAKSICMGLVDGAKRVVDLPPQKELNRPNDFYEMTRDKLLKLPENVRTNELISDLDKLITMARLRCSVISQESELPKNPERKETIRRLEEELEHINTGIRGIRGNCDLYDRFRTIPTTLIKSCREYYLGSLRGVANHDYKDIKELVERLYTSIINGDTMELVGPDTKCKIILEGVDLGTEHVEIDSKLRLSAPKIGYNTNYANIEYVKVDIDSKSSNIIAYSPLICSEFAERSLSVFLSIVVSNNCEIKSLISSIYPSSV